MAKERELEDLSPWEDAQRMIAKAQREGVNLVWDRLLAEGRLFATVHGGGWVDVGTPEGLVEADRALREAEA